MPLGLSVTANVVHAEKEGYANLYVLHTYGSKMEVAKSKGVMQGLRLTMVAN